MGKPTKNTSVAVALAAANAAAQLDANSLIDDLDIPEATFNEAPGLSKLSEVLLKNAVQSVLRVPSPSLKPDFRAYLNHMALMIKEALKNTHAEIPALVDVVQALALEEGARFDAIRLIKNVQGNCLWQASIMVHRDRNPKPPRDPAPYGLDGAADNEDAIMGMAGSPERETQPTEDEAIEALTETNLWLGALLDLLVVDENDRDYLSLQNGLEFMSKKVDNTEGADFYVQVYDVNEAIDLQLAKNEHSLKQRSVKAVQRRASAFESMKAMYARKAA